MQLSVRRTQYVKVKCDGRTKRWKDKMILSCYTHQYLWTQIYTPKPPAYIVTHIAPL